MDYEESEINQKSVNFIIDLFRIEFNKVYVPARSALADEGIAYDKIDEMLMAIVKSELE